MIEKSKWFVGAAALVAAGLVGQSAWSGKPETDKIAELTPKVAAAKASIKSDCGCDVGVVVKFDSYKTADEMGRVDVVLGSISKAAGGHCGKPEGKRSFCSNLSAVELQFAQDITPPKIEGKTLKAYCNFHFANSQGEFGKLMDKF